MLTVSRGFRALRRSPLRGSLLVGVLGVSIGLALIMITVNGAFAQRLDNIKGQVGTAITVRPAGSFGGGFFRGGDGGNGNAPNTTNGNNSPPANATPPTLSDDQVSKIASVAHVSSYSSQVSARYTGTELKAVQVQRPNGGNNPNRPQGGNFTPPILVTGTADPANLASLDGAKANIASGRTFNPDEVDANVAVLGQGLASANSLSVGSTFQLNGTGMTVVGIYSTGTTFGDNSLFLPLETTRRVFNRAGEIDEVVVQADSAQNVSQVATDIRSALGQDTVDVSTQEALFTAIEAPLSDAKSSSEIGMIVALVASAAIILFSVGLVARQRVREIGILKAIGASNFQVVTQFGIETAVLSVFAALLGALATFPLAQSVANSLVSSPSVATGPGGGARFAGGGPGAQFVATQAGNAAGLLGSVDVAVSPIVFVYALAIAIGLALIATVVPAAFVGRVRPAEVLRNE